MFKMTGAELIIQLLERQGVRVVAGIPGGANLPLYDALSRSGRIRHVLTRHEQGAGFLAQGMARATGRPAVFLTTSGPGATNALTAVADAWMDSVPVIWITGQVPTGLAKTKAFQEVDIVGMSTPITKYQFAVRAASGILEAIPQAFRLAGSGRPGPVLIEVPRDVQAATVSFDRWPDPGRPDPAPRPDPAALRQAADMIRRSHRPVLYLGGGIIQADAAEAALRLAERIRAPAAMTLMALGAVPHGHPLNLGMTGMHGARHANLAMDECDLLITAGARFGDRATGQVPEFCPRAALVHIDVEPGEINRIKTADLGITGDAGEVLEALTRVVPAMNHSAWRRRIETLKEDFPGPDHDRWDLRSPAGLIHQVAARLDERTVITTDVGQHQMWTAQSYPFSRPRQFLTSGGLGTMGFGLPAALGAALACPGRRVVCWSGDGSLLMNVQELATLAELDLPVKVIVMNNRSLGLVHQQQELFFNDRIFASDFERPVDYARIAEGFGIPSVDLGRSRDPLVSLEEALGSDGPCLIDAPIHAHERVMPMVAPGGPNREMIVGRPQLIKRV